MPSKPKRKTKKDRKKNAKEKRKSIKAKSRKSKKKKQKSKAAAEPQQSVSYVETPAGIVSVDQPSDAPAVAASEPSKVND